jgi:hypothetical protein
MAEHPPRRWLLDAMTAFFAIAGVVLAANALSMLWTLNSGGGPGDVLSIVDGPLTLRAALFHLAMGVVFAWTPVSMRANIRRRFAAADRGEDAKP